MTKLIYIIFLCFAAIAFSQAYASISSTTSRWLKNSLTTSTSSTSAGTTNIPEEIDKGPKRTTNAARMHEAKKHFSYVMEHLLSASQISEQTASEIWKVINHGKPISSVINKLSAERKLAQDINAILTSAWENSLGQALNRSTVTHDPSSWSSVFQSQKDQAFESRAMRAFIYEQTKSACLHGFNISEIQSYQIPEHIIKNMQKGSFVTDKLPALANSGHYLTTEIKVIESDTIDAAYDLKAQGYYPVALNFANQTKVGGGVIRGAKAQEEDLFRRSAYFLGLNINYNSYLNKQMQGNYSIPEFGAIYTPGVSIIRGKESEGYPFIQPFEIDFIASAAYDIQLEFPFADEQEYRDKTKEKIRNILRLGVQTDHDSIVLGAFGCGAFKNPPKIVAEMFTEMLSEPEFQGQFRIIVFAILCSEHPCKVDIFQEALSTLFTAS